MSRISLLTIGFIEKRPETAVRAITTMDPSDAAAFFETLTTRHAVSILSRMSAWSASSAVSQMDPVGAAAVMSELDYQIAASIVRIAADADRDKLLKALPKKLRQALTSTLTYPADTVGAKMSNNIVVMTADQTTDAALSELLQTKRPNAGIAFVVDGSRKLLGIVTEAELSQRSNDALLGDVIDRSVMPISARARLITVKSLPVWDDYAYVPVVNRQKLLIGALSRRAFRQPDENAPNTVAQDQQPSIFVAVASAFAITVIGLFEVLSGAAVDPNQPVSSQSQGAQGDGV